MRARRTLAIALAVAGLGLALGAQEAPQVFRSGVAVVSLNVTVSDSQQRFITDLEQGDFNVFEDGAKQELIYFSKTHLPLALSLLIDTSASMEERLLVAQDAAVGFAQRVRPRIWRKWWTSTAACRSRSRSPAKGGPRKSHPRHLVWRLHIAVQRGLHRPEGARQGEGLVSRDVRRQAIVVLSDGEDTTSLVSFEEVMELAKRSETVIYTIGLQPREPSALKGFREAEFVLRQFAQETGGRSFFVQKAEELTGVYGQISDELSSQYTWATPRRTPSGTARGGG